MIQFISLKQKALIEHLLTPLGVKLVITDKSQFVTCKGAKALLVVRNGQLWLCRGIGQKWSQQDNLSKWINEVRNGNEIPTLRNIPFQTGEEILMGYLQSVKVVPQKLAPIFRSSKDRTKAFTMWKSEFEPLLGEVKTAILINNFKSKVELCRI